MRDCFSEKKKHVMVFFGVKSKWDKKFIGEFEAVCKKRRMSKFTLAFN